MSRTKDEYINRFLLIVITALIGILVYFSKLQIQSTQNLSDKFINYQLENAETIYKIEKSINKTSSYLDNIYKNEIHPNTLRSIKNSSEIIYIKSDVKHLKPEIK